MWDIVTVGSNTIDWFLWTHPEMIHRMKRHHLETWMAYPIGAKILVEQFRVATGGGGTNTAATFSRLGLKTAYLSRVGADSNGDCVLADLKKYNVVFLGKRKGRTGFSVILDSGSDRKVLTYKGANDEFLSTDVNPSKLRTKWFYFSAMIGKSYEALERLALFAKKNQIQVAFNPSSYLAIKGKHFLGSLLKKVDVLILNKEEAQDMVGRFSGERLVRALAASGPKIVAVTDGGKGVEAWDGIFYYKMPARKVRVVETLGAGDAFAAGFVTGLILGYPTETSLKLGLNNAESCIQVCGAKEGLLSQSKTSAVLGKDRRSFVKKRVSGIFK